MAEFLGGGDMNDSPEAREIRKQIKALQKKLYMLPGTPRKKWSVQHIYGTDYEKEFFELFEKFANVLTSREAEVLTLIVRGLSNKEIANIMSVSDKAVKFHAQKILRKFDAKNRTAAVFKLGLYMKAEGPFSLTDDGILSPLVETNTSNSQSPNVVLSSGKS